ncbi:MAG TPA: hypothetical protein V6D03_11275 [Candidatus Caenarcaniphilales bacterium]
MSLAVVACLVGLGALGLEVQYRRRPGNDLVITRGDWNLEIYELQHYRLSGELELYNQTRSLEIMVPEVRASVTLLSDASLDGIAHRVQVTPHHPDAVARPDGYWFGYIVKVRKKTSFEVCVDIQGIDLSGLQAAWIQIHYITYGPQGRIPKSRHEIVPLKFPGAEQPKRWRPVSHGDVLPIYTHLLTPLDNPVEIVRRYVAPHSQLGDVVTLAETPVAIMQGRLRHPSEVHPGWIAQRLCYFFLPTSSLATACGLQALIDIVGPVRVVAAFVAGAIAKVFGRRGVFYQLAGAQARLIDDVTGTLPPYDQFIVLGPENPQQVVDQIQAETGLAAAIVDVNDLKAVKVLAASRNVSVAFLGQALRSNPAGNADEQTPIVLIRPTEPVPSRPYAKAREA